MRIDDRGAVLPIVAILLVVLMLVAAFVVDLGGVRVERAANQVVADAAASAGALTAGLSRDGVDVCQDVKAYVAVNSSRVADLSDLAGIDCSAFVAQCVDSTPEYSSSTLVNGVLVEIAYPVEDDSAFMASRQLGAPSQPASSVDGDRCERVGVRIQTEWQGSFSRLVGTEELPANVHAVAKSDSAGGQELALNLLTLDRTACMALRSNGGAQIRVLHLEDPDADPDTAGPQPGVFPGVAASDSNGDDCSPGQLDQAVLDVNGGGSIIADGPAGCDSQIGPSSSTEIDGTPFLVGKGCGVTAAFAPGLPGCNWPGCDSPVGGIVPEPIRLPARLTRAPVDHEFNCDVSYEVLPTADIAWATDPLTAAAGQDISDCESSGVDDAHIYDLIEFVGEEDAPDPIEWEVLTECSVDSPDADGDDLIEPVVFDGDYLVDCKNFSIPGDAIAVFTGNVVFNGSLSLTGGGVLGVNVDVPEGSATAIDAWASDAGLWEPNSDSAFAFFRATAKGNGNRSFSVNGSGGGVALLNTMVYLSRNVTSFSFNGGDATRWIAPIGGGFKNLALWSDTDADHDFAGQAGTTLEGVFFAPWAAVKYAGGSDGEVLAAQFVSGTLEATGQGELLLRPSPDRAVKFPLAPFSVLIR